MKTVVTHSGSFHPDDVFAVATLQLKFGAENISVVRSRDEVDIAEADYVVDVGHVYDPATGRFDHHQNGAPIRDNGIPYAAFGLVWKEFGEQIAGSVEVAKVIDEQIGLAIDAPDNGISLYDLTDVNIQPVLLFHVLHSFKPPWGSDKNIDDSFLEAVDFTRSFLERTIVRARAEEKMKEVINQVYESAEDTSVLIFDEKINTHALIAYPDVKVAVCPTGNSDEGKWKAIVIPKAHGTFENRAYFPQSWAGLHGQELVDVCKIKDASFCHKGKFYFVASSKEGAVAAAMQAQ